MAYLDHNGMVQQGNGPQRDTAQSVNGASNWSPWGGQLPNAYETGFEARNYAPGGYRQSGNVLPNMPAQISAPAVRPIQPIRPLGNTGTQQSNAQPSGGTATYQTGIEHGLLSNDTIAAARARLQPTAPMPTSPGVPTNQSQQSQMAQQYQDLMSQGTLKADMGLSRDAAYQQAQMALAQQKALAGASTAGMGNLVGLDSTNTQLGSANQAADTAHLGLQQGMLLRMLQGIL